MSPKLNSSDKDRRPSQDCSCGELKQLCEHIDTSSGEALWVLDANLDTLCACDGLEEMLGESADTMEGRPLEHYLADGDDAAKILGLSSPGVPHAGIYRERLRRRDGSTFWALLSLFPQSNGQGYLLLVSDIARDPLLDQNLVRSEELFRTVVENSPDFILRYDRNLERVYMNPAVLQYFNQPASELLEETSEHHTPLDDPERYMANLQRVIDTGKELSDEIAFHSIDGKQHWGSTRFAPEFDQRGNVVSVLAISNDITQQKEAESRNLAHLKYLQSLDRINLCLQAEGDFEEIMNCALDEILDIFHCDRAFLLFPCDPDATEWSVPIERTVADFPGAFSRNAKIPVTDTVKTYFQKILESKGPCRVGKKFGIFTSDEVVNRFHIKASLVMSLQPKVGKTWLFGIHQCSNERDWTDQEVELLNEIGYRISDALSSLLIAKDLRESEERFRLVYENSPVPLWEEDFSEVKRYLNSLKSIHGDNLHNYLELNPAVIQRCADLVKVTRVNQAAIELHEASDRQALLSGLTRTFTPDSYDSFKQEILAIVDGKREIELEGTVRTFSGKTLEVSVYFAVCPGFEESLERVFISLIDISERKKSEAQQRLAASVFESSQEGILISDAHNRIIDINPAFSELTGYSPEEVIGRDPSFLSSGNQPQELYQEMWQSLNNSGKWQGELKNRRKNGHEYTEHLSISAVTNSRGELMHYVGVFSDVSLLKKHEEELDRLAHYDTLTNVPNRRLLRELLDQAIARAKRQKKRLAVCYLDLDGFKQVNDQLGHEAGDQLLQIITKRLQHSSRSEDTVARLGGDEFVLLWNDVGDQSDCIVALRRILDEVAKPVQLNEACAEVTVSIGISIYPDDDVDADTLLRHADHAMYTAKQQGSNRYQFFDPRLEQMLSQRAQSIAELADALNQNQLELYYQPKFDWSAQQMIGTEALLRWNHPLRGLLHPDEFLPQIENDPLAIELGRWVLARAIEQAKRWDRKGISSPISINIFPNHLRHSDFVGDLRSAIKDHWPKMPQGRLILEITESSHLEELEAIETAIQLCLAEGVRFSLDDFGTGYSSLTYLRGLSIEELKIDHSFVRDMLDDPGDNKIVNSVIQLGKSLGLRVVAEGVESLGHAQKLRDLGCPLLQGFALGMPMSAIDFEQWLDDYRSDQDGVF